MSDQIESLRAAVEKAEREIAFHANDLAKRDLAASQQAEEIKGLRKALVAADRLLVEGDCLAESALTGTDTSIDAAVRLWCAVKLDYNEAREAGGD